MKKSLLIVGILMTTYTNVLAETQWTTPVDDGNSITRPRNVSVMYCIKY